MMNNRLFSLLFLVIAMVAGLASAENRLYIDDVVLKPDQAGSSITIPVKASFDSHVSTWDISFVFPEGMRPISTGRYGYIPGPDLETTYWSFDPNPWYDEPMWREETATAYPQIRFDGQLVRLITFPFLGVGFEYNPDYDPDYDDEPLSYGGVKWEPGEYLMFSLKVEVDYDFFGGEIEVISNTICGYDTRFGNVHLIEDSTAYPIPYPYEYEDSTYISYIYPGEVNGDGTINVADITCLIDIILSNYDYDQGDFHNWALLAGDMDANGLLDLTDVMILSDFLLTEYEMFHGYRMVGYEPQTVESAVNARVLITGDLSGDGDLGINDVTMLIDALLEGQSPDVGDVNGDGMVNISDVTALIDFLLSMGW